ncbi:MAG: putative aromatic amino acid beta-eliminating lyase/threonine aldolase [Frankiales bacterium]|nr:putative aromatic amino acid beta-eliminating lyase/threonine aldolase [Frankiales bacterium]
MAVVVSADAARSRAVSAACSRRLSGHGRLSPAQELALLADEAARGEDGDVYGDGGLVTEVEQQVAGLLGAEAAVLLPSGTMAQQVALRLHADARGPRRVAMHPTSHPLLWEDDALQVVQGLVPTGEDDVEGAAALLVELPRRETGGHLLPHAELVALAARCADAGTALHLDGARLWECAPAYGDAWSGLGGLADTVYVSLYKGLGATAGAVLLGPADLVAQARVWRHRLGGTLPALWPLALGARRGLRVHLPRMAAYTAHAVALADAVEAAGLAVVVRPQTPLLHVLLPGDAARLADALLEVSARSGVYLGGGVRPRQAAGALEVSAGEAGLQVDPAEAAALLVEAVARAATR